MKRPTAQAAVSATAVLALAAAFLAGAAHARRRSKPAQHQHQLQARSSNCSVPSGNFYCNEEGKILCQNGWSGEDCKTPICSSGCNPLFGACASPDQCLCRFGWQGPSCDTCMVMPGCSHGYCNSSFQCICEEGWTGFFCNIPVCHSQCRPSQGFCKVPGECRCHMGWKGELCEECLPLPGCQHGTCMNPMECRCESGWQGFLCDRPVCASQCHPRNGFCEKPGTCRCRVGWNGTNCETCIPHPGCVHGGCSRPWECNCEDGWGGFLCNQRLDYCANHTDACKNQGRCISLPEDEGWFRCACPEGFTGASCEAELQRKGPGASVPQKNAANWGILEWLRIPLQNLNAITPERILAQIPRDPFLDWTLRGGRRRR